MGLETETKHDLALAHRSPRHEVYLICKLLLFPCGRETRVPGCPAMSFFQLPFLLRNTAPVLFRSSRSIGPRGVALLLSTETWQPNCIPQSCQVSLKMALPRCLSGVAYYVHPFVARSRHIRRYLSFPSGAAALPSFVPKRARLHF